MSKPLNVLIVEDSESDAALLCKELRGAGYEPRYHRVDSLDQLSQTFQPERWDIVLADNSIPGLDAVTALRMLRDLDPNIPFIVVTGTSGEELAVAAMKAGANDYVMKDNLTRLGPAIERELRESLARRQRRASERHYRALFEKNPQPMWVYDPATLFFLDVNQSAVQYYGYSREEFLAMTIETLRPEEDIPLLRAYFGDPTPDSKSEWRHRKKDGTIIDVEVFSREIWFSNKRAALIIANDITERKQLEAQLRQAQKMEAVGRLAGGIAHDFNNLLTAIIGYSDLLMADPQAGGYSRDCADEIRKAGKRASTLTSQLLAFSRKQVLNTTSLNLNDVVAETQSMLRRLIGEDVKLVSNLNANLWHISGDQGQIEQILLNLAVNSRDAMPAGGTLTVETANVDSARLEAAPDRSGGRYVMLRVTDTGCGMDSDTMSRIFEPFFTTKERGKGTGLGLSTVYGIVKQSGGVIAAESEEGMGTSFTIYLPAAAETKPAVEPSRVQVQSGGGTETVLVVEDDDAVLRLTSEVLVSAGYTVFQAQNVEDAIRSLEEKNGKVDLVLTDIVLPAANAMALTQGPSALKGPTKLLFMSGYSDDNLPLLSESVKSGAFLQKPFTPNALLSKVREVLTRA